MAYAQMPQFVSIHGPKIGGNELPMATITEVLQSDPVKRLFQRQNVYLQSPVASSSKTSDFACAKSSRERSNGAISELIANKKPELSVIPIMTLQENASPEASSIEDKHLLPSKFEGKSGVALVPIRRERRRCGHYEPCESLVCDVSFQQFADNDTVCPMIAVNIDASEIDAPVTKHCASENCDALSIDHDRCRRAIIRCHRCDVTNTCDICLVVLKTRKSQVNHKNCKMRIEYRHNRTSRSQILRDRMRQREVQILEAARVKKKDYADPLTGHDRAIESLHNNSELIVIPKASLPIQQHPTIRITSVTGSAITPGANNNEMFLPRFPVVFPQQGVLGKRGAESADHPSPVKQPKIVAASPNFTSGSPNFTAAAGNPRNSYITVTRMPARNFIKPVNISNLLQPSPLQNPATTVQANPFLMPVRLVQTQGIPKYCLVPDTASQSSPVYAKVPSNMLSVQQPVRPKPEPSIRKDPRKIESKTEQMLKRFKPRMRRGRRKKEVPKKGSKSFECTFCFKRFSTDWYFKLHIAKHKGEIKFTCKFCKKPFMHLYNMTKHVVTMHKKEAADESFTEEDGAENVDENEQSLNCVSCDSSFESIEEMEKHPCCILCLRCQAPIRDGNLMVHLKVKHSMSDEKAVEEYERQKRESGIAGRNRMKMMQLQKDGEMENGLAKKRRAAMMSKAAQNMRRLTRRKRSSHSEEIETILPVEMEGVDEGNALLVDADVSELNQSSQESTTMLSSSDDAATTDVVLR